MKENINHLKDDKLEKSNYPTESFTKLIELLDNSWKNYYYNKTNI